MKKTNLNFKISLKLFLLEKFIRFKLKAQDYLSILHCIIFKHEYLVVGCYNTGNIGDVALGLSLKEYLAIKNKKAAMVSFKVLKFLHLARFDNLVIGGGGVLTTHNSSPILNNLDKFNSIDKGIFLVGVSGDINIKEISEEYLKFLISCKGISIRSNESFSTLEKIGVKNIYQHDDLAFIFDGVAHPPSEKVISVNLFSPLVKFEGRKITQELTPSDWYKEHLPSQAARYTDIPPSYVHVTKKLLETARARGYKIRCVSFTVEDYIFSRTLYSDLIDDFTPFTKDLNKVSTAIRCSSAFIATRFHAHVFSAINEVPFFSMSYADKCTDLCKKLALNDNYVFETMDWVERPEEMINMFEYFISNEAQGKHNTSAIKNNLLKNLDKTFGLNAID